MMFPHQSREFGGFSKIPSSIATLWKLLVGISFPHWRGPCHDLPLPEAQGLVCVKEPSGKLKRAVLQGVHVPWKIKSGKL